jgi:hypothetical protein
MTGSEQAAYPALFNSSIDHYAGGSDRLQLTSCAASQQWPMPFKSQAQRRKFAALLVEGKISPQTFEEWNRETGGKKLPERVKLKKTKKTKTIARKRK